MEEIGIFSDYLFHNKLSQHGDTFNKHVNIYIFKFKLHTAALMLYHKKILLLGSFLTSVIGVNV